MDGWLDGWMAGWLAAGCSGFFLFIFPYSVSFVVLEPKWWWRCARVSIVGRGKSFNGKRDCGSNSQDGFRWYKDSINEPQLDGHLKCISNRSVFWALVSSWIGFSFMVSTVLGHKVLTLKSQNICFTIHDKVSLEKIILYLFCNLLIFTYTSIYCTISCLQIF